MENGRSRWLAMALTYLIWFLVALSLTGNPGVTALPPGLAICLGGLLSVVLGLILVLGLRLTRVGFTVCILAQLLLVIGFLSARGSLDPFLAQQALGCWTAGLGVLCSLVTVIRSREEWRVQARFFIVASGLSTLFAVWRSFLDGGAAKGNFTNPDCFSVVPLTGALLALTLIPQAQRREKFWLAGGLGLMSCGVLLTASRSGALGLLTGLTCYAILTYSKDRARQAITLALFIPLLISLLLVGLGKSDAIVLKWRTLVEGKDRISYQARLAVLRGGVEVANERPLLGYGPGNFALAFQHVRPGNLEESYMNVAHNDTVQLLVEFGYSGMLVWLMLLALSARNATASCRRLGSLEHAGAISAVLAIEVYSLGNFATPVLADLIVLCFVMGLSSITKFDLPTPRALSSGLAPLFIGFGLYGCFCGHAVWKNNDLLSKSAALEENLHWEEAYQSLEPGLSTRDMRIFLQRSRLAQRAALFQGDVKFLSNALVELEAAHSIDSVDLKVLLGLADLYESQGRYEDALNCLLSAEREAKGNVFVERSIARNQLLQGHLTAGVKRLMQVIQTDDAQATGELLAVLEKQKPGAGLKIYREWGSSHPQSYRVEVARIAGVNSLRLQLNSSALGFFQECLKLEPANSRVLLLCIPLESRPLQKLELANKALAAPGDDELRRQALSEWVRLRLLYNSDGKGVSEVVGKLESYLAKTPRSTNLRIQLSEIYEKLGRSTEARRVLRDGLDSDPDGLVHASLGALYERNGSPDIAASYYEEALKLQPKNESLRHLVQKLQAPKVTPEDPTRLKLPAK